MGGSLGVGEPEQGAGAPTRRGERQSALGCHCCSGGTGRRRSAAAPAEAREPASGSLPPRVILSFRACCPTAAGFCSRCGKVPKDSPPFPFFFCCCCFASFSLRWDEFGQNRRGSERTAAPRRGPRVSFTEKLKQQQRNFRELKQRVFGR